MFCIPSRPLGPYPSPSLLNWPIVQSKLAWGVIILRGGGFSMAETATVSFKSKKYYLLKLIFNHNRGLV